jgi:hypothetical protein
MKKDQISAVLGRVRTWPAERQEDAAGLLLEMEAQDASPYRLNDEQVAELRRRRVKRNPKYVSLAEARGRFRRSGGRD